MPHPITRKASCIRTQINICMIKQSKVAYN